LNIHDDVVPLVWVTYAESLEDTIGPGLMIGKSEDGPPTCCSYSVGNDLCIGGYNDLPNIGLYRTTPTVHDHWLASNVGQGLVG
jgi:hypothetical protein